MDLHLSLNCQSHQIFVFPRDVFLFGNNILIIVDLCTEYTGCSICTSHRTRWRNELSWVCLGCGVFDNKVTEIFKSVPRCKLPQHAFHSCWTVHWEVRHHYTIFLLLYYTYVTLSFILVFSRQPVPLQLLKLSSVVMLELCIVNNVKMILNWF